MGKLTDRQRKHMIADRANGMSMPKLAAKYNVSTTTVARTLKGNPEAVRKVNEKKEQNTLDMLAYMDARKSVAQELVDAILTDMADPERRAAASFRELATALGILVDKFTATAPKKENEEPVKIIIDV